MARTPAGRIYDLSRSRALRDLIELHPGEYEVLRAGYAEEVRRELEAESGNDKHEQLAVA